MKREGAVSRMMRKSENLPEMFCLKPSGKTAKDLAAKKGSSESKFSVRGSLYLELNMLCFGGIYIMYKRLCLFLIVFFSFFTAFCYADEIDEKKTVLDEIVVTATRDADSVRDVPASVIVITSEDIKKSGVTNIPELLEKEANIHFRSYSGNSSQAMIDLRGLGGDNPFGKTLILLNGRRLNRPDMKSINWLQIPIQQIEKIEVVKGTGTVLYGDSAVAGVINIITKRGSRETKTDASISAGSNNTDMIRAGATGSKDKLSFAVNAENYNTDGYRERTGYYNTGAGVNIGYDLTDTLILNFDASFNKNKYEMPGSLTKEEMKDNPKQAKNSDDEAFNNYTDLSITVEKMTDGFGDIELKLVYGNKDIDSDMASWFTYYSYSIDTIGFLPKYKIRKDILGFENKFVIGADVYSEKMDNGSYSDKERNTKTGKTEIEKNSIGFYARDEIYINDSLITAIGFRKEKARFKAQEFNAADVKQLDEEDIFDENALELGLTKLFNNTDKIFCKISNTYRFPFSDEKVTYGKWLADLKPEKGKSYEMGGSFSPFNNFNMELSFFNIDIDDAIIYVGQFPNGQNENFGKTKHRGIELDITYNIKDKVKLYGKYTYNKATFENGENNNKEIPMVPNNRFIIGGDFTLPYDLYIAPKIQYVGESYLLDDFDNNTEQLDSYTVCDLYFRYEPLFIGKKITAFFGVKNIFDKEYYSAGSDREKWGSENEYYPAAGREFNCGISFNF